MPKNSDGTSKERERRRLTWWQRLPLWVQAFILVASAAGLVWANSAAVTRFADAQETLETRVDTLHTWRVRHDSLVTGPVFTRLAVLEEQVDSTTATMREVRAMVFELWCVRFPDRCQAIPRPGGPE